MTILRIRPSIQNLKPSATLVINEMSKSLAAEGKTIYRLGFGQSPFPIPDEIVEGLKASAHEKDYLPVKGLPALRASVADFNRKMLNLDCTPDQIMIGPGSKELILGLQMVCEATLCLPAPSWVSYEPQAAIAQNPIEWIQTKQEEKWLLTADRLKRHLENQAPARRILLLNYPSNPVGSSYTEKELLDLAETARSHNVIIVSDEIYGLLTFAGSHRSIASYYPEGTIVSSGLSKWCGAGGWRLGTFTFPKEESALLEAMAVVASESFSAVSAPVQFAAIRAFEFGPSVRQYVAKSTAILSAIGQYVFEKLTAMDISMPRPEGGFYLFPNFESHRTALGERGIRTSKELCHRLLNETGIALLPGTAFGVGQEQLVCRLSYVDFDGEKALSQASKKSGAAFVEETAPKIIEALRKLETWLFNPDDRIP